MPPSTRKRLASVFLHYRIHGLVFVGSRCGSISPPQPCIMDLYRRKTQHYFDSTCIHHFLPEIAYVKDFLLLVCVDLR